MAKPQYYMRKADRLVRDFISENMATKYVIFQESIYIQSNLLTTLSKFANNKYNL